MAPNDNGCTSNEVCAETTAVLPHDDLSELDELAASGAEDADESTVAGLPSGAALLIVKRGPNAGARFLLNRDVSSAGRHPDSDIFLDDITVSRRHVEFRHHGGEFLIADAGSLNGTYVNRQPVDTATLANHDEIQIGKFRLVFLTSPSTR
ncbi:MAG TPA: FHA domain-containing protein [Mycobacterium sp.]|nr:FHA domain-containing protein [Mycobacterium sp.]